MLLDELRQIHLLAEIRLHIGLELIGQGAYVSEDIGPRLTKVDSSLGQGDATPVRLASHAPSRVPGRIALDGDLDRTVIVTAYQLQDSAVVLHLGRRVGQAQDLFLTRNQLGG